MFWWLEPMWQTGLVTALFGLLILFIKAPKGDKINSAVVIFLICLLPMVIAFVGTIVKIICWIFVEIWSPYI